MSATTVINRRVLGAVRLVDAVSGRPVDDALVVRADAGVAAVRNRRGLRLLVAGAGASEALQREGAWFDAPPLPPPERPAPGSVAVRLVVRDPSGRYLDRAAAVRLPRDPDAAHAGAADSVFRAVDVALYPAPARATAPTWALARVTTGVPHALVRVVPADRPAGGARIGAGVTDARGEALVAVAGGGPPLRAALDVRLELVVDPAHDPASAEPPDPDDLEARRAALTVRAAPAAIAAGRTARVTL